MVDFVERSGPSTNSDDVVPSIQQAIDQVAAILAVGAQNHRMRHYLPYPNRSCSIVACPLDVLAMAASMLSRVTTSTTGRGNIIFVPASMVLLSRSKNSLRKCHGKTR